MFKTNRLKRAPINNQNVVSGLPLFMSQLAEQHIDIHCLSIYHAGQTIAEISVEPYQSDEPHMSYSLAKGFVATAIGLLIDEGRITLNTRLSDYFIEYKQLTTLNDMTLHDALTMCTGHSKAMFGFEFRSSKGNWLDEFLSIPYSDVPGKTMLYNSGTSYLLSVLVERITGMPIDEYLQRKLFDPMNLGTLKWEKSPQGSNTGGWGLNISAHQLLSIAVLYLNKGIFNGERLLSEAWVNMATTLKVETADESSPCLRGYGYHIACGDEGIFFFEGAYGQLCLVDQQSQSVVMIYGGHSKLAKQRQLVYETLLPDLRANYALHGAEAAKYAHSSKLTCDAFHFSYRDYDAPHSAISKHDLQRYKMTESTIAYPFDAISFICNSDKGELVFHDGNQAHHIAFGLTDYYQSTTTFSTQLHEYYEWQQSQISAIACWISEDTLRIVCRYINKVYVDCFELKFGEHAISITRVVNLSSLPQKTEQYDAMRMHKCK